MGADGTIAHRISGGHYAGLPATAVTVTILETTETRVPLEAPPEAFELSALTVTGGEPMYPAFASDIRHYAIRCADSNTFDVAAASTLSGAQLTLLHDDASRNQVSTDTLRAQVTVGANHDIAIELRDGASKTVYVVHCIPPDTSRFRVITHTDGASGGLLFINAAPNAAEWGAPVIVDYHGVVRYVHPTVGRDFRPWPTGPTIDGRQVAYSIITRQGIRVLGAAFNDIRYVQTAASHPIDWHDFALSENSFLFIAFVAAVRDYSTWDASLPTAVEVHDSVIVEVPFDGGEPHQWNSWEHLKIVPDCAVLRSTGEYAHLNSLQLVDGDVIASFRGCAQVTKLGRSSGSWNVQWKLGGSAPPRDAATEYLEITGDPLAEFCGQHHVTLFDTGEGEHILLFDNGNHCIGSRKQSATLSRVVEYDISSGTHASFVREYRRPAGHGYSPYAGGAVRLENGNWLISWGSTKGRSRSPPGNRSSDPRLLEDCVQRPLGNVSRATRMLQHESCIHNVCRLSLSCSVRGLFVHPAGCSAEQADQTDDAADDAGQQ